MTEANLDKCPLLVKRYFTTPQPDIPEDLQFLPPGEHRKVYNGLRELAGLDADRIKDREDLIVDHLIFMVEPWYVEPPCFSCLPLQRMLDNRRRVRRTYPQNVDEFFDMLDHFVRTTLHEVSSTTQRTLTTRSWCLELSVFPKMSKSARSRSPAINSAVTLTLGITEFHQNSKGRS
jgi:hypothetical protein